MGAGAGTPGDDGGAEIGPTAPAGRDAATEAKGHEAPVREAAPMKRPAEVETGATPSGGGVRPSRSAARNGDTRGRDEEDAIAAVVEVVEAAGSVAAAAEDAAAAAQVLAAEDMT
jgi:hypothetical protein